jgi:hypothetical protein
MRDTSFFRQAELLLRILPLIYRKEIWFIRLMSTPQEKQLLRG